MEQYIKKFVQLRGRENLSEDEKSVLVSLLKEAAMNRQKAIRTYFPKAKQVKIVKDHTFGEMTVVRTANKIEFWYGPPENLDNPLNQEYSGQWKKRPDFSGTVAFDRKKGITIKASADDLSSFGHLETGARDVLIDAMLLPNELKFLRLDPWNNLKWAKK